MWDEPRFLRVSGSRHAPQADYRWHSVTEHALYLDTHTWTYVCSHPDCGLGRSIREGLAAAEESQSPGNAASG